MSSITILSKTDVEVKTVGDLKKIVDELVTINPEAVLVVNNDSNFTMRYTKQFLDDKGYSGKGH